MHNRIPQERLQKYPELADVVENSIRRCVHCGVCTSVCPTYILLGDERDGPRGRIDLMRDILESPNPPSANAVLHIDRCIGCLACADACPSRVQYRDLLSQTQRHISNSFKRPLLDSLWRSFIASNIPAPRRARTLMRLGSLARKLSFLRFLLPKTLKRREISQRIAAAVSLKPPNRRVKPPKPQKHVHPKPFPNPNAKTVALISGCVQNLLDPAANAAVVRLLTRFGHTVHVSPNLCCGALPHHLAKPWERHADRLAKFADSLPADAVALSVSSGCHAMLDQHNSLLPDRKPLNPASIIKLIPPNLLHKHVVPVPSNLAVAHHVPCSLDNDLNLAKPAEELLLAANISLHPHSLPNLCCGAGGAYALTQPLISQQLKSQKAAVLLQSNPNAVASWNVGCLAHLAPALHPVPIVHAAELLDWATGGPKPLPLT